MSNITGNILNPTITREALRLSLNNRNTGLEVFDLTHITLGDVGFTVTGDETAIPGEKMRATIADATRVQFNTVMLRALFADKELPGFWVRSVGFWAGDLLFAVWSHATETLLFKSPKSDLVFSHHLELAQIPPEQITVNVNREAAEGLNLSLTPYMAAMAAAQIDAMLRDVDHGDRLVVLETQGRSHAAQLDRHTRELQRQAEVDHQLKRQIDLHASDSQLLGRVSAWQSEQNAEILRSLGQSGLFMTRGYAVLGNNSYDRYWSEGFNPANIHNHVNYAGMPGTAEFAVVVNGYYLRTRHNDYLMRKPSAVGAPFLATDSLDPPALPQAVTTGTVGDQMAAMRTLFQRYEAGEMPPGFGWSLTYVEFWFEPMSDTVAETFPSFRHQDRINNADRVFQEAMRYNAGGYKDRFENVRFEAPVVKWINADGRPVVARLRYRMATVDVSHLGDMRKWMTPVEDLAYEQGFGRPSSRYKIAEAKNAPGNLDRLMAEIPGLDGFGASLTETYLEYGQTASIREWSRDAPINAANYNRFARLATLDAANRDRFHRGFNDPNLFVASTTRPEVLPMPLDGQNYRFTYALPFELILRTPLESWNPHALPEIAPNALAGNGSQAAPYNGVTRSGNDNGNSRNYRTPADFFATGPAQFTDVADTGFQAAWVLDSSGTPRLMRGSGIYVVLPAITGLKAPVRVRHPIYPVFEEGSHAYAQMQGLRRDQAKAVASLAASQMELMARLEQQRDATNTALRRGEALAQELARVKTNEDAERQAESLVRVDQARASASLATAQIDGMLRQLQTDQSIVGLQGSLVSEVNKASVDRERKRRDMLTAVAAVATVAVDGMVREVGGQSPEPEINTRR